MENAPPNETVRLVLEGDASGERLLEIESALLKQLQCATASSVVVDLTRVQYLDSRGITLLIKLYKTTVARKQAFLIEANPEICKVLEMANLTRVLSVVKVPS